MKATEPQIFEILGRLYAEVKLLTDENQMLWQAKKELEALLLKERAHEEQGQSPTQLS